ncbi:MAG TPA: hypothetical protein VKU85_20055 [bacterium]|nr:hypothetical protein [bacterium]
MSAKPQSRIGLLLAVPVFALASAGCSSNPPCETDLAAVDQARAAAKAAEDKLQSAQQQQTDLQQKIQQEEARQASLEERKAELMKQIADLEN